MRCLLPSSHWWGYSSWTFSLFYTLHNSLKFVSKTSCSTVCRFGEFIISASLLSEDVNYKVHEHGSYQHLYGWRQVDGSVGAERRRRWWYDEKVWLHFMQMLATESVEVQLQFNERSRPSFTSSACTPFHTELVKRVRKLNYNWERDCESGVR